MGEELETLKPGEDVKVYKIDTSSCEVEQNMNRSVDLDKLAAALAKAQGQIHPAAKDSTNPDFKYKYADLSSTWDACRKPLSDNGLAVIQTTKLDNTTTFLITTLIHSSGQWIRGSLPLKPEKEDTQSIGSAITYARRYALASIVGVAPEDDKDGAPEKQDLTICPAGQNKGKKWSSLENKELKYYLQSWAKDNTNRGHLVFIRVILNDRVKKNG